MSLHNLQDCPHLKGLRIRDEGFKGTSVFLASILASFLAFSFASYLALNLTPIFPE